VGYLIAAAAVVVAFAAFAAFVVAVFAVVGSGLGDAVGDDDQRSL